CPTSSDVDGAGSGWLSANAGKPLELVEGQPLVDLGNRQLDLLLAHRMRRRCGLTLEVRFGQTQRFELAHTFGVDLGSGAAAAPPLRFPLLDLFLNPSLSVDESFSGITHRMKKLT